MSGSDQHPPSKEGGGARAPSVTSVNPEAADSMQEALEHASVVEEYRTLTGRVRLWNRFSMQSAG